MKYLERLKRSLSSTGKSFQRYPLTAIWLVVIAIMNAIELEDSFNNYARFLFTALTGVMLSVVAQHIYERFSTKENQRWLLFGGALVLTALYFITLPVGRTFEQVHSIRTMVLLFALFITLIWLPTFKREDRLFHQNFLAIFKGSLTSLLFSIVLSLGSLAIYISIDNLLFSVDFNNLMHVLNIIWSLFAPLYFLGLVPANQDITEDELMTHPFTMPRFLEVLLTFIVIPIVAIYTIILLLYLVVNISGEFWTDNLLEPMLVSYAIAVIVVYLLVLNTEHPITTLFRKVFPKIMLPIVLLQTVASILKIQELGMTHGRYYVIMFGIFATVTGLIFSFLPPNKNGWLAFVLLVLSLISVTPPIDAFPVARNNQEARLTDTLNEQGMLVNNEIVAKRDLSIDAKIKISKSVDYLTQMNFLSDLSYLPDGFSGYYRFEETFGFPMTFSPTDMNFHESHYAYLGLADLDVITLDGIEFMLTIRIDSNTPASEEKILDDTYLLLIEQTESKVTLRLQDKAANDIITANLEDMYQNVFVDFNPNVQPTEEDMTHIVENDQAVLTMRALSLEEYDGIYSGEIVVFIDIK